MSTVSNAELLGRITQQRANVDAFLAAAVPRKRRLLNTTIIGGSLAAALTAGPAVGGPSFTAWLTAALGLTSPSWRLLCGGAAVCSIMATVATQLLKSDNVEQNVTRAQGARAKLEVLELGLKIGQLDERQALTEYLKCVEETAFLVGS
jgi:MFS family permease